MDNCANAFFLHKRYFTMAKTMTMTMSNNNMDLDIVHKYKDILPKDSYNNIIHNVLDNKVSKIFINNNYRDIISVDNLPQTDIIYNHYHIASINPIVLPNLVEKTSEAHVPIYFTDFNSGIFNFENMFNIVSSFAGFIIPTYILWNIFLLFSSRFRQPQNMNFKNRSSSGGSFFGFLQKDENEFNKPNVTLSNWAGSPEVLEECKEVITYIENKERFNKIGAEMPRGILLEGPPGTGKTLLAKAVASATNSTFISIAASEFVELYVGMGASRVRELFKNARENKPCIIFIDEIDAVGRQRGAGINMANDEREQTLNQLLYEMDGFSDNEDIIIMAATNRKDVLDQALLRPGRFDRIIKVPLPDKSSREKILSYYLENKLLEKPFDIDLIAELTSGFSGAQLKNLINEAAILSARNNYTIIQEKYMFDAFEKSIVGLIKTNASVAPATKLRVALHEAGHTLLVLKFKHYFDFQKVSIQPTYNGAGGYTLFTEKPEIKEGGLYTKDLFKKRLIITMGGKAAESIYYGDDYVSLGAVQDLNQANSLAKRMVGNFGMGNKLEVFYNEDIGDESNPFLGRTIGMGDKYSQNTKYIMDKESLELVNEAYQEAKKILSFNRVCLVNFTELLYNNTILYKKDIDQIYPPLGKVEPNLPPLEKVEPNPPLGKVEPNPPLGKVEPNSTTH
jgi:cell division protease FtsH